MMLITTGLGRILPLILIRHKILTITVHLLKIAGSVLTGFISELNDSDAVISLNDGSLLSATLANQGAVKQGEVVTFIVNQVKDNQISLKVLPADEQQNMFIDKALEAAGLYPTEENTAMVKELLSLNMPVIRHMKHLMPSLTDSLVLWRMHCLII